MTSWLVEALGLDHDTYREAEREARRRLEAIAQEKVWENYSPEVIRTRKRIRARWRLARWRGRGSKVVDLGRR